MDLEPKDACCVNEELTTQWSEHDTGNRSGGGNELDRGQIHMICYLKAFGWLGSVRFPTRGGDKYRIGSRIGVPDGFRCVRVAKVDKGNELTR
jgi:hypothetical protein